MQENHNHKYMDYRNTARFLALGVYHTWNTSQVWN